MESRRRRDGKAPRARGALRGRRYSLTWRETARSRINSGSQLEGFLHNVDKPFEIHRVIVRLTPKGLVASVLSPLVDLRYPLDLDKLVRVKFMDVSKNENLTKSPVLVGALQTRVFDTWEWEEPYTLVRSEGLQVQVDTQTYPFACIGCEEGEVRIDVIRIEITLQGFLVVVAPPSETR